MVYEVIVFFCFFMLQINNAGVNYNIGTNNSVEFSHMVISTNYYGTKNIINAMIPLLRLASHGARIVNVTSRLGRVKGKHSVRTYISLSLCFPLYIMLQQHDNFDFILLNRNLRMKT